MTPVKKNSNPTTEAVIPDPKGTDLGRAGVLFKIDGLKIEGLQAYLATPARAGTSWNGFLHLASMYIRHVETCAVYVWDGTRFHSTANFNMLEFPNCCGALIVYDLTLSTWFKGGKPVTTKFDNGEFGVIVDQIARTYKYTSVLDMVPVRYTETTKAYASGGFESVQQYHNNKYNSGHDINLFMKKVI